jgi:hypothetical protein
VKRIAASAIVLVQLWMLAPVCCCWFKAAASASGGDDCCCSQSDDGTQKQGPVEKSSNCRCSENKIELPPQTVVTGDLGSQRLALVQILLASTQSASCVVKEPTSPQDLREWPPPLSVADRLSTLQRLNL